MVGPLRTLRCNDSANAELFRFESSRAPILTYAQTRRAVLAPTGRSKPSYGSVTATSYVLRLYRSRIVDPAATTRFELVDKALRRISIPSSFPLPT